MKRDAITPALSPLNCRGCFLPLPVEEYIGGRRRKRNIYHGPECRQKAMEDMTHAKQAARAAKGIAASREGRLPHAAVTTGVYTAAQTELLKAMDRYKRENKRPFPTYSEVLQVVVSLGYRKCADATALPGVDAGRAVRGDAEGEGSETGEET